MHSKEEKRQAHALRVAERVNEFVWDGSGHPQQRLHRDLPDSRSDSSLMVSMLFWMASALRLKHCPSLSLSIFPQAFQHAGLGATPIL